MSDYICKSCEHYLVCKHADNTITSCSQYFELVRCGKCKCRSKYPNEQGLYKCCGMGIPEDRGYLTAGPDDYCSNGERKDDE